MSRETVAFDIDDVLVETAPAILRHYEEQYGIIVPIEHFYSRDLTVWGVEEYGEATRRVGEYLLSQEFDTHAPYPEAVLALNAIASKYRLVAVTGRPSTQREQTESWLSTHFDVFEEVRLTDHFNENHRTKGEVCNEIGADWLIDDHIVHLRTLGEYGIRGMLFGGLPWGQGHALPRGVYRADTWREVQERLKVTEWIG